MFRSEKGQTALRFDRCPLAPAKRLRQIAFSSRHIPLGILSLCIVVQPGGAKYSAVLQFGQFNT